MKTKTQANTQVWTIVENFEGQTLAWCGIYATLEAAMEEVHNVRVQVATDCEEILEELILGNFDALEDDHSWGILKAAEPDGFREYSFVRHA